MAARLVRVSESVWLAQVLRTVAEHDPRDECHCLRLHEHFSFRGHLCLACELLSMSLYEFLKVNCFMGVSLPLIRRFAVQLQKKKRMSPFSSLLRRSRPAACVDCMAVFATPM